MTAVSAGPSSPARMESESLSSTLSWITAAQRPGSEYRVVPVLDQPVLRGVRDVHVYPLLDEIRANIVQLDGDYLVHMLAVQRWNTTVPSILFRNSGLKNLFTSSSTFVFIRS